MMHVFLSILNVLRDTALWLLVILVLAGALPLVAASYQFLLVAAHFRRNHYGSCQPYFPRTAVLIPAWNEAAVIGASIDRLIMLDYPPDALRVYVVDDASTDDTPNVIKAKAAEYPGQVFHLRREKGGQGKAHTLNHGLAIILSEDWMQALLIMDADVIYTPSSLRMMARHLADPRVGAVTAYIKEGSRPGNYLTRYIGFEYITAQAAARRCQNVLGAVACLAGGAQLHSRANLEAVGGRIDTSSLAEDTFTTFKTQLAGNRVVFEPHAVVWAEEPDTIVGLWKQRLRWARGNVQVTKQFKHVWCRPSRVHRLGSVSFSLFWFCLFLLPVFMICASVSLVILYFGDFAMAWVVFRVLWITSALTYVFITGFTFMIDWETGRHAVAEGILFPGLISFGIIIAACFPGAVPDDLPRRAPGAWRHADTLRADEPGTVRLRLAGRLDAGRLSRQGGGEAQAGLAVLPDLRVHRRVRIAALRLHLRRVRQGTARRGNDVGQDREDREGRDADVTRAGHEVARRGAAEPPAGTGPADLPEEFRQEVTTALKYERGLVVKASAALAIVILVVLIRMLFPG
jgi:cellulose synthase/poly-beta-1,6-N-acetylglucosamine synthase-like glycosyltransferase